MSFTVAPTLDAVYTAIKAMLVAVLPLAADHVVKGNINRVPMPSGPFALMNVINAKRVSTNLDYWDPAAVNPTGIAREQHVKLEMQIDLYGPDSGDWAAIFTTLFRDDYGCIALAPNCQPLHADEPTRAPLVTGEEQYLDRWIIRGHLQYNPVVTTTDQFANVLAVDPISVDERYPP